MLDGGEVRHMVAILPSYWRRDLSFVVGFRGGFDGVWIIIGTKKMIKCVVCDCARLIEVCRGSAHERFKLTRDNGGVR
ncbi:uncharacterized protein HKW66_Vig0183110 [Vigna angularis]|uniref:Uncharacterized protein n=1 Tax=Phaseolus angularis TaxID=3914 RepID=A0A8T0K691_PHAAN|nr:uncharacterized protein HKW66_Vig0183110 [Vigna angularis]